MAAAAARKRTALRPLTAESDLGFLLRGAILDDDADDDDWEYALAHCNDDEDTTHPVSIWKGVAKTLEF